MDGSYLLNMGMAQRLEMEDVAMAGSEARVKHLQAFGRKPKFGWDEDEKLRGSRGHGTAAIRVELQAGEGKTIYPGPCS
jgi:hypothetical protein